MRYVVSDIQINKFYAGETFNFYLCHANIKEAYVVHIIQILVED